MKAYRIVSDLGAVAEVEFELRPGGVAILWQRVIARPLEADRVPRITVGAPMYHAIERPRRSGRVIVAIVVGPRRADVFEPDWSRSVLLPVVNEVPAHAGDFTGGLYGGIQAADEARQRAE